jgi:hypothetical protein
MMTEHFDDQLLDEFVRNHYGYGNYNGKCWFIGMEPGGGNTFDENIRRLNAWAKLGKHEVEDLLRYHEETGVMEWFYPRRNIQRTWSGLIRIYLSSTGQTPNTEQVREYQSDKLARLNGDTCLLELLPLPSPSTDDWLYAQSTQLPYLINRETYKRTCLPIRIAHLRQRISEHKPSVVVFYGMNYQEHWQDIAKVDFNKSNAVYVGRNGSSLFVMTNSPTYTGTRNEDFHKIGRMIATELKTI